MDQDYLRFLKDRISLISKIFSTPKVYVAGGCLRDLDNGKDINDIDIFVSCDDNLARQVKHSKQANYRPFTYAGALERLFKTESKLLSTKNYTTWNRAMRIMAVEELDTKPHKIQTILYQHAGTRGPRNLLEYFDINLCKISFDGNRIYRSDEYKRDVENKTITIDTSLQAPHERTLQRVEKLKKKFPEFSFNATAHELTVQRASVEAPSSGLFTNTLWAREALQRYNIPTSNWPSWVYVDDPISPTATTTITSSTENSW
jgi:hypothetical protein